MPFSVKENLSPEMPEWASSFSVVQSATVNDKSKVPFGGIFSKNRDKCILYEK